ncbi:thioredoxin family protein [Alisedimentitalea sp. MJ-SS2]|uniref:thioredoxin family protein n=1 Tax=Aliisedimentitalea sp. MJ-SS2 TaxID=3049795 RepID=UPI002913750C|nr:thioredoxin family protein [Alisedimentitalea sp. MJ-SS2]MDU8929066.1 thioredoxin family protein [Alisedimentitalea sp. MJ-SS2]
MFYRAILALTLLMSLAVTRPAQATELVMVEEQGCYYCITWKNVVGPIYPKTPEGVFAPLRMIDIDDGVPTDLTFARKVVYTPTFILIDQGREVGRIEGYPGEDFFWGLLEMMLEAKTDYQGTG